MYSIGTNGGDYMTENKMLDALKQQQEIADILGYLESKGYKFSEREKGRIEQMLIDGKLHTQSNPSAVT